VAAAADAITSPEGLRPAQCRARAVRGGGGFALALHGYPRFTKDVDILNRTNAGECHRTLKALEGLTWGISRELDPADIIAKPFTIVGDDPRVDILTLACSIRYADAAPKIQTLDIEGVAVPIPDIDTLIRTKQTDRLRDKADVEELERIKVLRSH